MKLRLLLLAVLAVPTVSFASCQSKGTQKEEKKSTPREVQIRPDSAAYVSLGKTITDVLFNPRKVKCYHVVPKAMVEEGDVELHANFVRDTLIAELDERVAALLQYGLLAQGANYGKDSVRVRSPYNPELEFVFEKKKAQVHVLVSPSDFSWSVLYDDKLQFNCNYQDKPAMRRFCDLFLK